MSKTTTSTKRPTADGSTRRRRRPVGTIRTLSVLVVLTAAVLAMKQSGRRGA
jgi:hypothetical protein